MSAHFVPKRPDQDGDPAREGTCGAWVADRVINGDASSTEDMLGETHENGWTVDEDMVRHIQWYVDVLMARPTTHKAEFYLNHPTLPIGGTMDHVGWSADYKTVYVDDLKYGYGPVEPSSWQLVAYVFLLLSNMPPEQWPTTVHMSILQPRAMHKDGPYRTRTVNVADLQPDLDRMQDRIVALMAGENTARPGKQCMHCLAASSCTALTKSVYSMWEPIQSREILDPTPAQLSEELIMLERMETLFNARNAAVKAEAEARMGEGQFIPGWGLEDRYGKRKFTVDPVAIQLITGISPDDVKVCTPAELIRRGAKEDVVKTITTTPRIGTKLSRVDETTIAAKFAASKPS